MLGVEVLTLSLLANVSNYHIDGNITRNFRDFAIFAPGDEKSLDIVDQIFHQIQKHFYFSGVILLKKSPANLLEKLSTPFLVFAVIRDDVTPTVAIIEGSIELFQHVKIIFIFVDEHFSRAEQLAELFSWCWKVGVFGVVAVFSNSADVIYSFVPFPHMRVVTVQPERITDELFLAKTRDHQGTILKRAIIDDFPRSFTFIDTDGIRRIGGYIPKFIATFIAMMNASVVDVVKENGNIMDLFEGEEAMSQGRVDLATFVRTTLTRENLLRTIPLSKTTYSYLVPFSKSVPASSYIILPFSTDAWIGIFVIAIFVAISDYIYMWTVENSKDFGRALCNAILGITSQSLPSEPSISWRFRYIRIQVIVLGFILTNFYLALLASFMTTTVYEPQMKTYKDIRGHGEKLLGDELHVNHLNHIHVLPDYGDEIIQGVEKKTYLNLIFTMNGTHGIGMPSDDESIILYYQSFLKRPIFYVPGLYVDCPYTGTLVRKNSSFLISFEDYIRHVWASGLLGKWREESIVDIIKYQFEKKVEVGDRFKILTTENLVFISLFYGMGIIAAILCFVVEIVLNRGIANEKHQVQIELFNK